MKEIQQRDVILALEELLGNKNPPDLQGKILKALEEGDANQATQTEARPLRLFSGVRHRFGTLASAACLVIGLGLMAWSYFHQKPSSHSLSVAETRVGSQGQESVKPELLYTLSVATSSEELKQLPDNITRLVCHNVTDSNALELQRFHWLEELFLRDCLNISDDFILPVSTLQYLNTLDLYGCGKITDQAMNGLLQSRGLKVLDVGYTQVTDVGIEKIARTLSLVRLDVCGCDLSDSGLSSLVDQEQLKTLNLWDCKKVTLGGLRMLVELPVLREVGLRNCDALSPADISTLSQLAPHWAISR